MPDATAPDARGIARAAKALREGELVVFPTETVYGVGAHALDPDAVKKIFQAKGRPADNPLIVHVPDVAAARRLTRGWPTAADALAHAFWPGPLTLVLPRAAHVPDITTGGLDTVALRVPSHGIARLLLQAASLPIAAPSANRSGRPSPTRIQDAIADLGESVHTYLDGGPTYLGLESTVVALADAEPTILRQGSLPRERIEELLGPLRARTHADAAPASPGMKYRHYAPSAQLHLHASAAQAAAHAAALRAQGERALLVTGTEHPHEGPDHQRPGPTTDAHAWARTLFATLRDADARGYRHICIQTIPDQGLGAAVMDRLRKAAER